jgi:hypothetical protein
MFDFIDLFYAAAQAAGETSGKQTSCLCLCCPQLLCTTWRLNPKALALLPGSCIAVPLLPVLTNIAASRTCLEHPNLAYLSVTMNAQIYACISIHQHAWSWPCKCFVFFASSIPHGNRPHTIHTQHCRFKCLSLKCKYSNFSTAAGFV